MLHDGFVPEIDFDRAHRPASDGRLEIVIVGPRIFAVIGVGGARCASRRSMICRSVLFLVPLSSRRSTCSSPTFCSRSLSLNRRCAATQRLLPRPSLAISCGGLNPILNGFVSEDPHAVDLSRGATALIPVVLKCLRMVSVTYSAQQRLFTDLVHRQIVPNTVLPAARTRILRFRGVVPEPFIDISQMHTMPWSLHQSFVDQNGIRLVIECLVIFLD